MKLPEEKIRKLQELYRNEYGEEITLEEAEILAEYLTKLLRAVYEV